MKNIAILARKPYKFSISLIFIITLIILLPPALFAASTWTYEYASGIPDPGYSSMTSSGANDSGSDLYAVFFEVSLMSGDDSIGSTIYKLNRNQSADPFVDETWSKGLVRLNHAVGRDVATDRRKDVYVVGAADGNGGRDAFIRKYRSGGARLWTRRFHSGKDSGYATVADSARNVYMVGVAGGPDSASSNRGDQGFIRKYNESGRKLWTKKFGSSLDDKATAVAVDRRRNVYVAGVTNGPMGRQYGGTDGFLRKYSRTGKHLWTRQFGTPKNEIGLDVTVDERGKIYVAGATNGNFRGQRRRSGQKFFLRKFSSRGSGLWTRQFGRASVLDRSIGRPTLDITAMEHTSVRVDSRNNVYVSGSTPGGWVHVHKFNRRGRSRWGRNPIRGNSGDLTMDSSNFYIIGDFSDREPYVAKFPN